MRQCKGTLKLEGTGRKWYTWSLRMKLPLHGARLKNIWNGGAEAYLSSRGVLHVTIQTPMAHVQK